MQAVLHDCVQEGQPETQQQAKHAASPVADTLRSCSLHTSNCM